MLYVVTEPWYFANHRLDHARALLAAGFDVHVATRRGDRWDEIAAAGCSMHELSLDRGITSPGSLISEVRSTRRLVRDVRPDVVHAVALKPVAVVLGILPMRRRPSLMLGVNGLGISAADGGARICLIRAVLKSASRLPRVSLLFQTRADRTATLGTADRGVVIPGVGVDTVRFAPQRRDERPPLRVVYLGRAVASKGLPDLVEAMRVDPVAGVELHLYCAGDPSSPGALSAAEIDEMGTVVGVEFHEATDCPQDVLGTAHAAVLASRAGEGVSKFVLEALACGTPVLLSAESGSGEVIESGATGLVFAGGDPASFTDTLRGLAGWDEERWQAASEQCRRTAEERYSLDVILPQIVELHRQAASRS